MSDPVIQSQLQNPLLYTLRQSYTSNLSYKTSENFPALSKALVAVSSQVAIASSPWGQEVTFNLPRNGFMDDICIRTEFGFTNTTAAAVNLGPNPHIGEHLFRRIELLAQNKVIATQTYASLKAKIAGMTPGEALAIRRRTVAKVKDTGVSPTWGGIATAVTVETFTPFLGSCFKSFRQAIDLTKCEDFQVRCYFQLSSIYAFLGAGTATTDATMTGWKSTLYMNSHVIDQEKYLELHKQNFKNNNPLSIISYDFFEESFKTTDTTAGAILNCQLRCNGAVAESSIFVQADPPSDGAGSAITNTSPNAMQKIVGLTFVANGLSIFESLPQDIIGYEGDYSGSGEPIAGWGASTNPALAYTPVGFDPVLTAGTTPYSGYVTRVNWGLVPGSTYNSGLINFKGLSNPTFVVKLPATATNSKVYIVHRVFTIITITADGSVSLTTTA